MTSWIPKMTGRLNRNGLMKRRMNSIKSLKFKHQLSNYPHILEASRESVDVCRRLAEEWPAVFNEDLAESLMCLSRLLSDCGRPEPQPSVIQEAVDLYRRPVADEPAPHLGS